ncbi:MAG TPA: PAS domain S-box protein [Victivallales bacterium]|nr:PAS domain S-box protein [Victivallales bacterium]
MHSDNITKLEALESILTDSLTFNELGIKHISEYGDLTVLNTERLILDAVGYDTLLEIMSNYLSLINTSAAVYEKNGDYAFGIFSSNWCKYMDSASRKLCNTDNNKQALNSGKWHCHESCWTDCSKVSIETKKPVDIVCNGGIRIYSIPIFLRDEVIGAINMGYGIPSKDIQKLKQISNKYKINLDILINISEKYNEIPEEIIKLAKKQINYSAKMISSIVEAHILKTEIQNSAKFPAENPNPVLRVSKDGKILYANEPAQKIIFKDNKNSSKTIPATWDITFDEIIKTGAILRNFEVKYDDKVYCFTFVPLPNVEYVNIYGFDITRRKQVENSAIERMKELQTLYGLSNIVEREGITMDEIYQAVVKILPSGWQYPEIASARITINNKEFWSENYINSDWKQTSNIKINGTKAGNIELNYMENRPFLEEEKLLLNALAERLGRINERKLSEEIIHVNEKKLRTITETAKDAIIMINDLGNVTFWNSAAKSIFGYNANEIIGKNLHLVLAPKQLFKIYHEKFSKFKKGGQGAAIGKTLELPAIKKDGSKITIALSLNAVNIKNKWSAVGIARDITESKIISTALAKAKTYYQGIISNMNDGLWVIDTKGKTIDINQAMVAMLDYESREELLSKRPADITSKKDKEKTYETMKASLEGQNIANEIIIISKTGREIPVSVNCSPLKEMNGNIIGGIAVIRDITEYKKISNTLEKKNKELDLFINNVPEVIYAAKADETGSVLFISKKWKKWTGYSPEECYKEPDIWLRSLHNEDKARVLSAFQEAIALKKNNISEYRLVNKDTGEIRWVLDHSKPVINIDGSLERYEGVVSDITEYKELKRQIFHAQKMEALSTLTRGLGHEFNNSIGVIAGYTELLQEEENLTSEEKSYLEQIRNQVTRSAELVKNISIFGREDKFNFKPISLDAIIKEALSIIRVIIPSTVEFITDISCNHCIVSCNANQIQQVIINICNNSSSAMDGKPGTITIKLNNIKNIDKDKNKLLETQGPVLCLSISDTGCGISVDNLNRIFTPFFTTKKIGKGTGLGLSVVHGIIKNHGGKIKVDSEIGIGTTFNIYLPAIQDTKIQSPSKKTEQVMINGKWNILIVEDETALANLFDLYLNKLGYNITRAKNGIDALKILKAQPKKIDLIFTDHIMPKMTGLLLSKKILNLGLNIPVILTTGYTDLLNKVEINEYGISAVLYKPVGILSLTKIINKILEDKKDGKDSNS